MAAPPAAAEPPECVSLQGWLITVLKAAPHTSLASTVMFNPSQFFWRRVVIKVHPLTSLQKENT